MYGMEDPSRESTLAVVGRMGSGAASGGACLLVFVGNKENPNPLLVDFLGTDWSELELAMERLSCWTLYRDVAERLLDG